MRDASFKTGRTGMVCGFFLFQIAIGSAFAQGAEAPAAMPAPAADASNAPFGGCEPIGMTASGELVFPLECKHKIQLQPAPVASEEKTPAADDKPVTTADAKPALTDTPAAAERAAEGKPTVETKAAAVEDKAVAPAPAVTETLATTDKLAVSAEQKPAAPAVENATGQKPAVAKAESAKDGEKPLKKVSRRVARAAAGTTGKQVAAKQVVAMAKPAQASTSAHVEEKAAVQTAGLLPCAHYRSYNAAAKSYRGFDGRMYGCR
jgi:hypothetical protein